MSHGRKLFLSLFTILLATGAQGAQRTFVSAGSGSDSNLCTRLAPCRNFAAAITQTDPGGEVVVLDSGGYGPVVISQAVAIVSPTGVDAAITAFSGNAISIAVAAADDVVLRGLYLNDLGGTHGVEFTTGNDLHIEHCVVHGFIGNGIYFHPSTAGARMFVTDTIIRENYPGNAIQIVGSTDTRAVLDSVRMFKFNNGAFVQDANVVINNSVASGGSVGFWSFSGGVLTIDRCVSANNSTGTDTTGGGFMMISRSTLASNTSDGIYSFGTGSTTFVSDSTISGNATGVDFFAPATITSLSNNTLRGNTASGAFSGTVGPN